MIKPLLRVIPSLSGNVKLACNLFDFNKTTTKTGETVFEANVRYAKLLPLSSKLFQKKIDANLLGGSWNFDLKKFYETYSDSFYNSCFIYNKEDMLKLDETVDTIVRNTDMEFGVKRISYMKNESQFAFFAPIYIDSVDDIPSYFLLNIKLSNNVYDINKTIKINIGANSESKYNYIYKYLAKYLSQIDDNVLFCTPNTNQATYYGIDLVRGGFVKAKDNTIAKVYRNQNTIQNFDALVSQGFQRNKLAMKQIIPLAFYFNINDLLSDNEKYRYRNQQVVFSGNYYDSNDKKLDFYDFNIDYDEYYETTLQMTEDYGNLIYMPGKVENIMDVQFPSLNEARYIKYQFANKLSADFCRWKLKYSEDEHPYIMNMSWAFSNNADSNYRYREFPVNLHQIEAVCDYIKQGKEYQYNLTFPLSTSKDLYDWYDKSIFKDYSTLINQYATNWFSVEPFINESIFKKNEIWRDVSDDCVYYNGILYDLKNLYDLKENPEKVDKFAVILKPNPVILDISELKRLKFVNYTLFRQSLMMITQPNVNANDSILEYHFEGKHANFLYTKEDWEEFKSPKDRIDINEIYSYAYDKGSFVDLNEIGMDYYDLTKYYNYNEVENGFEYINKKYIEGNTSRAAVMLNSYYDIYSNPESKAITGYLSLPIYKSELMAYDYSYDNLENVWPAQTSNVLDMHLFYDNNEWFELSSDFVNISSTDTSKLDYISNKYKANYNELTEFANTILEDYLDLFDDTELLIHECFKVINKSVDKDTDPRLVECATAIVEYLKNNVLEIYYESLRAYFSDNLYYRSFDEKNNIFHNAYITWKNPVDGVKYSYIISGQSNYNNTLYGNNFYSKSKFFKSADIEEQKDEDFAYEFLHAYVNEQRLVNPAYWNYSDIWNPENYDMYGRVINPSAYASYLFVECNEFKKEVGKALNSYVNKLEKKEYEFLPISETNGQQYASDTFIERTSYTSKFYGDSIPYSKIQNDVDVLWADLYNLNKFFLKYDKQIPPRQIEMTDDNCRTFYTKFLNKEHVYYYYVELFKDMNRKYKDYNHNILVDKKNTTEEVFLTTEYNEVFETEYMEDYSQWILYDWWKTIFIKHKVWVYDTNIANHPIARIVYTPLFEYNSEGKKDRVDDFIPWYNRLRYDKLTDLFYFKEDPENKFELVFTRQMYRVNKILWDMTDISDIFNDVYRDVYFYRLQLPEEWDLKYGDRCKIKFYDRYSDLDLGQDFEYNKGIEPINHFGSVEEIDTCLIPMFDDIFNQQETEALIVAHYKLNNISETTIQNHPNPDTDTHINYRYNKNDKKILIQVTDDEKKKYNFTKTYELYNENNTNIEVEYNDLGYKDWNFNTYVDPKTGIKYGFYCITSTFNNTSNSLHMTGIVDGVPVYNIKYVHCFNGEDLNTKHPEDRRIYIANIYKQLAPFIDLKPLNELSNINTVVYPNKYHINLHYSQEFNKFNGAEEIDICNHPQTIKRLSLLRYMHNMTPLITKTNEIRNEYKLKLKDVNKTLLATGKLNSIGDTPIYKSPSFVNIMTPFNVYSTSIDESVKDYNNVVREYLPLEYKHFNCSKFINLEEEFEVSSSKKYKYAELLEAQTFENTLKVFENYINRGHITKFSHNDTLFLIKKYNVEYDSTSIGLTLNKKEKLYSLKYRFKLL